MYNELAKRAHDTAVAKGFWDTERNFGEMTFLIVSELAEALEHHRDPNVSLAFWYKADGKPDGVVVELADAMIRIFDILYHNGEDDIEELMFKANRYIRPWDPKRNFGDRLQYVNACIVNAWRFPSSSARYLSEALVYLEAYIEDFKADPEVILKAKIAYNETRPHMHGKKY